MAEWEWVNEILGVKVQVLGLFHGLICRSVWDERMQWTKWFSTYLPQCGQVLVLLVTLLPSLVSSSLCSKGTYTFSFNMRQVTWIIVVAAIQRVDYTKRHTLGQGKVLSIVTAPHCVLCNNITYQYLFILIFILIAWLLREDLPSLCDQRSSIVQQQYQLVTLMSLFLRMPNQNASPQLWLLSNSCT